MPAPVCHICGDTADKPVVCPITLGPGTRYDLVRCGTCTTAFAEPMPTDAELAAFYDAEYFDFARWKYEGRGRAFARKYLGGHARGRFLDVGCATGFFLNGVREASGWRVSGVDIGEPAARYARTELGLDDVRAGELTAVGFDAAGFDFIHVSNILEHAREPLAVLRECRRLLAPGGRIYLSIPNGDVDIRDLMTFWREEQRPGRSKSGHIYFFPAPALRRMITAADLQIAQSSAYGIRRGLRILGWYPRSSRWKKAYEPVVRPAAPRGDVVTAPTGTKHGDLYYRYRFWQGELKRLPGLSPIGLDYQLILTAR